MGVKMVMGEKFLFAILIFVDFTSLLISNDYDKIADIFFVPLSLMLIYEVQESLLIYHGNYVLLSGRVS